MKRGRGSPRKDATRVAAAVKPSNPCQGPAGEAGVRREDDIDEECGDKSSAMPSTQGRAYDLNKVDEKLRKRLLKNRLSAERSRQRKQEHVEALESELSCCRSENEHLKQRVRREETAVEKEPGPCAEGDSQCHVRSLHEMARGTSGGMARSAAPPAVNLLQVQAQQQQGLRADRGVERAQAVQQARETSGRKICEHKDGRFGKQEIPKKSKQVLLSGSPTPVVGAGVVCMACMLCLK
jgi:hypothetical protein